MASRLEQPQKLMSQEKTQTRSVDTMVEKKLAGRTIKTAPKKSAEKPPFFSRIRRSRNEPGMGTSEVKMKDKKDIEKAIVKEDKNAVWQKGQDMLHKAKQKGKMERETIKDKDSWGLRDWKGFLLIFIMFLSQYDYYNQQQLFHLAKKGGGVYMLIFALILSLTVQLPFLLIYSHLGHYNQAATFKVFGLYGRAFRFVGVLMVMSTSLCVGIDGSNLAGSLVYNNFYRNYSDIVSCLETPTHAYPLADKCCVSIYDRLQCAKSYDPLKCDVANSSHAPCWPISALKMTLDKYGEEDIVYTNNIWTYVVLSISILIPGLAAFFLPTRIFLIAVSTVGLIGLLVVISIHSLMYYYGSLFTGMARIWMLSDINKFFDFATLTGVGFLIMYGSSNFTLISLASMGAPKKRLYWAVCFVYLANILLMTFTLLGDFAVYGRLEDLSYETGAISSMADLPYSFIDHIFPEFIMTTTGLPAWLTAYHIGLTCLQLARFCSPLLDILALFNRNPGRWKTKACLLLFVLTIIFIPILSDVISSHESTKVSEGFLCMLNICLIVLSLLVSFIIYGPNQHIFDIVTYYPLSGRWYDKIGPTSPVFSFVFIRLAIPFLLIMLMLGVVKTGEDFEEIASLGGHQHLAKLAGLILLIPFIVFILCLVYDLILPLVQKEIPAWRLFYPQRGHPGYKRLVSIWTKSKRHDDTSSNSQMDEVSCTKDSSVVSEWMTMRRSEKPSKRTTTAVSQKTTINSKK